MTTEELVTIIGLRHKFKCEISEEDFQTIRPLKSDPKNYDFDIVNGKIVKRYTSHRYTSQIRFSNDDVEYYCTCFINKLKKRGYNIKSFRYLDGSGNVTLGYSYTAQQFSVAFTNPN
jgi:hypothetical protein